MYMNESEDYMPSYQHVDPQTSEESLPYQFRLNGTKTASCTYWMDETMRYTGDVKVYQCPSKVPSAWYGGYGWGVYTAGYMLNHKDRRRAAGYYNANDRYIYDGICLPMLGHSPSANILVSDLGPGCTSPAIWSTHFKPTDVTYYEDNAPNPHSNGGNFAFTDGHVQLYKKPSCAELPVRYYDK